jgi:hypothetical protein
MRPLFNFIYLVSAYSIGAGSVYFAFYEKNIIWARLIAYALGAVAALLIFGGERIVRDDFRETKFSSEMSGLSLFLFLIGLVVALFGLWVFDLKLICNVTISTLGWCVVWISLLLGAVGKLVRELRGLR